MWYGGHANNGWHFRGIVGLWHCRPNSGLDVKPSFIIPVFDLLEIGQTKHFDVRLKETAVRNFTADFIELQNLVGEIEFYRSCPGVLFGRQIMLKPFPVHVPGNPWRGPSGLVAAKE
jgi:hypothetical protein